MAVKPLRTAQRETKWGLTDQEMDMCLHYLKTPVNQRTFYRSYLETYKCAEVTARGSASGKFNQQHIKNFLDSFIEKRMEEVEITVNDALRVIKEIMENPEAKDADRLVAAEKVLKMNNAYEKHEESGASKTYLGMDMAQLRMEAKELFSKVTDSGLLLDLNEAQGEYVDYQNVEDSYEND